MLGAPEGAREESMRTALSIMLLIAGCTVPGGCSQPVEPTLVVYCGAGLRPPVAELIDTFSKRHRVRVEPVYTGSGILLSQITLAQRGDIYIPGDQFFMQQAVDKGYILEQAAAAVFIPVIAVRKGNPKGIKGLADLTRKDLKLGLGEEKACAIGRSSAVMLKRAGLTDRVKPSYTATTVNDLGSHLKIGTLDAAIIWDAVARFYPDEVEMVDISTEYREVLTVPVGVLRFTKNRELAQSFMQLVSGKEGKQVFAKHGYTVSLPK